MPGHFHLAALEDELRLPPARSQGQRAVGEDAVGQRFRDGFAAGRAHERRNAIDKTTAAIAALGEAVARALDARQTFESALARELTDLVSVCLSHVIAGPLVPAQSARIAAAVADLARRTVDDALTITVRPGDAAAVEAALAGTPGHVLQIDPELDEGCARAVWKGGAARIDTLAAARALLHALEGPQTEPPRNEQPERDEDRDDTRENPA